MENRLEEFCSFAENNTLTCDDCFGFHVRLVCELAANWRSYINFLEARLAEVVSFELDAYHMKYAYFV